MSAQWPAVGWPARPVDEAGVERLASDAEVSPVIARLLWLRGVRDAAAARSWLAPGFSGFHPPRELPDFAAAVERVRLAISRREGILIWGHDDLDGITAVALLERVLLALRARVLYYIPPKGKGPHGLAADVVLGYRQQGAGLVVTVDCGITNRQAVADLARAGMDVIVTDHHEVLDSLPPALANIDPKRPDSGYPYRALAGAGVALKLAMGLAGEVVGLSTEEFFSAQPDVIGLAVLGTLADRVPLTGENRTLVALGMNTLEHSRLPALRLVSDRVRQGGRLMPSRMVGELLPLFASAEANEGVRNILSDDPALVREWLDQLAVKAAQWRAEAEKSLLRAEQQVALGDGIVIVRDRELSLRALGFCAAKLKDRYGMPAMVLGWRGDAWIGECRSLEGIDLMALLKANDRFFIDYGGHKAAAGFSISEDRVDAFASSAEAYTHEHIAGRLPVGQKVFADASLPLAEYDPGLRVMAPFGEGNPAPVFLSEPVTVDATRLGWVGSTRPDLVLKPTRQDIVPGAGPVVLLYTIDDAGELQVLDFRVAGHAG